MSFQSHLYAKPGAKSVPVAVKHRKLNLETLEERINPSPYFGFAVAPNDLQQGDAYAQGVTTDTAGNVYVTGYYAGQVDFGNLTPIAGGGAFVAKYNRMGVLDWVDSFGADFSFAIAVDSAGDIYTTGLFSGTSVNFDPDGGSHELSSSDGGQDFNVYVSKFNSAGQYVWADDITYGKVYAYPTGIAVDGSQNVYTTGYFQGTNISFDPDETDHLLSSSTGGTDINSFVSKLTPTGQYGFAVDLGYGGHAEGGGITVDALGNVFSTGSFSGTDSQFDPNSNNHDLSNSTNGTAAYVSELSSTGQYEMAEAIGTGSVSDGVGIAVDASGNIFLNGAFASIANFDPNGTHTLNTGTGLFNAFVEELTPTGQYVFAVDIGNGGRDDVSGIALDSSDDVFTTGSFYRTGVNFDPNSTNHQLSSSNSGNDYNTFISEVNSSGQYVFADDLGYGGNGQANGVAVDSQGDVYTTGIFSGYNFNFNPYGTLDYSSPSVEGQAGEYFNTFYLVGLTQSAPKFQITNTTLPSGDTNKIYAGQVTIYGGSGSYSFTVTSGALPTGVNLDPANGQIEGTPTTAGTYTFTVSASDSNGDSASQTYTLIIGVQINTPTLPNGKLGVAYDQVISASGGVGVYKFEPTGLLPYGLTLNSSTGELSGTPTAAGQYSFTITVVDSDSSEASQNYTVTISSSNSPVVTGNPANSTVNTGSNASFSSAATGTPAPTAQWQFSTNGGASFSNLTNGGDYSGATSTTLSVSGVVAAMSGYEYRDVFTNSSGTATTTAATLSVDYAPTVTTNPTSQTINAGQNASFTAAANGTPNPTVQWLVSTNGGATYNNVSNGGVYTGATTDTLNVTGAIASMNGYEYEAVFSNTLAGAGSQSTATTTTATLSINSAPSVTANPTSMTTNAGGTAAFTAAATGGPAPTDQWQISTDGGVTFNSLTNGGVYSGTTTATLSIAGALVALNGDEYRDIFANVLGTATTTAATVTVDFAPAIGANPTSQTIIAGQNTSFTADATANPNPTVQWMVSTNGGASFSNVANGSVYGGATSTTLTVTGAAMAMNGYLYEAVFSNTLAGGTPGNTTTTPATLNVDFAPVITANPPNTTTNAGANASFTAAAAGGPTPTVQWLVSTDGGATFNNVANGSLYSGATTTTLSVVGATSIMNGYEYFAVFSNTPLGAGSPSTATTAGGTLTVDFAPTVTAGPLNQTASSGGGATFTASASNGNPATTAVQWQVSANGGTAFSNLSNGGVYSGVNTTTLSITGVTSTLNLFEYRAVFSNSANLAATTGAATLTVQSGPVVTANPANASAPIGNSATFSAQASGQPAPTVQWQVSSNGGGTFTNLGNGGNYSGVTTNVLTVSGITASLNGLEYRAVFNNGVGAPASSSAAVLTAIYQSQYVGPAYLYSYYGYIYSFDAYITGMGSYTAFVDAYYAYVYAQNANSDASAGNQAGAEFWSYYAYYYGYLGQYYAYQDYTQSNEASVYSYYAYLDGYYGQYYAYFAALGL